MARSISKQKFQSNNFDIDAGLDIPDFDFDFGQVKDDRNPTTKVAASAAKGVKDAVFNTNNIRTTIRRSLPQGYGEALDLFDQSRDTVRSLYNNAAREIRPAISEMRRVTRRVLPKTDGYLPKKIQQILKEFSDKEDRTEGADYSQERFRNDSITLSLGEIFKAQAEAEDKNRSADREADNFKQGIEQLRHRDMLEQLDEIRINSARQAQYQDKVLVNFHRKSLELQYRQYFATADILEQTKLQAATTKLQLAGILKNTGLPDYVKISTSEQFQEMTRERLMEKLREGLFGEDGGYVGKFVKNLGENVRKRVTDVIGNVNTAASAAGMASDASEMMQGGPSALETGANLGANMATGYGIGKAQDWLKGKIAKAAPGVAKQSERIRYGLTNSPALLQRYLNDPGTDWGIGNSLKDLLAESLPGVKPDTEIKTDQLSQQKHPAIFTNAASKSIIEVIPGLLSHIHRELSIMRTGQDSGLLSYDFTSNKFSTQKDMGSALRDRFVGKDDKQRVRSGLDDLHQFLDPQGKLTDEQKAVLNDQLLKMSFNRSDTDATRLASGGRWQSFGAGGQGLSKLFRNRFRIDKGGEREDSLEAYQAQREFSERIGKLRSGLNDPREQIQMLASLGQTGALRASGLLSDDGKEIDLNKLAEAMLEDDQTRGTLQEAFAEHTNIQRGLSSAQPRRASGPRAARVRSTNVDRSTTNVTMDSDSIVKAVDKTTETVRELSPLEILTASLKVQESIAGQLAEGIKVLSYDAKEYGDAEGPGGNKAWQDYTIGDIARGTSRRAKSFTSFIGRQIGRANRFSFGLAKGVIGSARKTLGAVTGMLGQVFGDVYVQGENFPRMTWAKMRAGEYADKETGKQISSFKDITGAVVDKSGNIVLAADEVANAYVNANPVVALKNLVSGAFSLVSKLGFGLLGNFGQQARGVVRLARGAVSGAIQGIKKILPPYDVYVKGEMEKPVLFANKFGMGYYVSERSGKPVKHPRDIDGPIKDVKGNYVLTEEQIEQGLVDVNGVSIRSPLLRALTRGVNIARKGFKIVSTIGGKITDAALGGLAQFGKLFNGFFGGIFGVRGEFLDINKSMLKIQTEILEVLKERLPAAKKKVVGDLDGDGIREGSYQDLLNKAKDKQDAAQGVGKAAESAADSKKGLLGSLAAMLSGKKKKEEEEDDDHDGSLLDDAADVADIYDAANGDGGGRRRRKGKAAKGGKLARLKGFGGKALRFGGKALGLAGAAYGAYSAYDNIKQGNYGEAALDAGMAVGGTALTAGLSGATLAGAGSVLTAAGLGLAGLLSSPVVLVGLGLGAAYLGYKYLTRVRLTTMNKTRYAQYGFDQNDQDHYKAVFELESKLTPLVKFEGGKASIDESKADIKSLVELFNVNLRDSNQMNRWSYWFQNRFKPVFLGHLSVIQTMKSGGNLDSVESLTPEEKLKYLAATQLPNVNYGMTVSPFPDLRDLRITQAGVTAQFELAKAEVQKDVKGNAKPGTVAQQAATAAAAATAAGAGGAAGLKGAKQQGDSGSAGTGLPSSLTSALAGTDVATNKGPSLMIGGSSNLSTDFLYMGNPGQLDALTSLRMKTYGLVQMDADKVRALRMLENFVEKTLQFTKAGAVYNQDVEFLLERVKVPFGVSGARSPEGSAWMKWFKARFLPVYLNYATAINKFTKKTDLVSGELSLKPDQAQSVANAVYTTSTVFDGSNVPVWQVPLSPWPDYAVNQDQDSVKQNLQFLAETTKAYILGEQKSAAVKERSSASVAQAMQDGRAPNPMSTTDGSGGAAFGFRKDPATIARERQQMTAVRGNITVETIHASGQNMRAAGDYTTGAPIQQPGKGTGGDINQIPEAKGSGWNNVKDTLNAAAKMAGVDPKLLATMTAIESGFNPNARPPMDASGKRASSATGLMQFIDGTWDGQMKKYASKYGIDPNTPSTDARANALLGAEYIKSNVEYLSSQLKRPISATDAYLAHFLGPGGAAQFLSADPNAIAAQTMPKQAKANPTIFFDLRNGGRARTNAEVYELMRKKVEGALKNYGIAGSEFAGSTMPDAKAMNADSSSQTTTPGQTNITSGASKPAAGGGGFASSISASVGPSGASSPTATSPAAGPAAAAVSQAVNNVPRPVSSAPQSSSVQAAPATPTRQADSTPAPSTPLPRAAPSSFTGFETRPTQTSREVKAQDVAQRAEIKSSVDAIQGVLEKQLSVQTEMRDFMKRMANSNLMNGVPAQAEGSSTVTGGPSPRVSRQATQAPVSMKN